MKRTLGCVAIIGAMVCAGITHGSTVRTQGGLIKGITSNGLTIYKGIPFAAARFDARHIHTILAGLVFLAIFVALAVYTRRRNHRQNTNAG